MKRTSYTKLLKEALSTEWDTTKTVDTKGPMLDPILGYDGGGELETNKDAASVLERFYFKEKREADLIEHVDNEVSEVPDDNIAKTKKDIEKEVVEQEEVAAPAEEEEGEEDEGEKMAAEAIDASENAVIEKLIAEMEEEISDDVISEQDDKEVEKDLDVDKEVKGEDEEEEEEEEEEDVKESAVPPPSMQRMSGMGDGIQLDDLEEAFQIFQEEIEEDEASLEEPKKN